MFYLETTTKRGRPCVWRCVVARSLSVFFFSYFYISLVKQVSCSLLLLLLSSSVTATPDLLSRHTSQIIARKPEKCITIIKFFQLKKFKLVIFVLSAKKNYSCSNVTAYFMFVQTSPSNLWDEGEGKFSTGEILYQNKFIVRISKDVRGRDVT